MERELGGGGRKGSTSVWGSILACGHTPNCRHNLKDISLWCHKVAFDKRRQEDVVRGSI